MCVCVCGWVGGCVGRVWDVCVCVCVCVYVCVCVVCVDVCHMYMGIDVWEGGREGGRERERERGKFMPLR